jgi:hypothetical protein
MSWIDLGRFKSTADGYESERTQKALKKDLPSSIKNFIGEKKNYILGLLIWAGLVIGGSEGFSKMPNGQKSFLNIISSWLTVDETEK